MAKRKRKVPKRRKRRKRKFGSVLDTVSTAISPVKKEIAAVIESNVPEGDDLKKKIGEKVSDAKKVNILSTNITQIKQELIKDIQADKFTFSNLKKYINEKGNIAVESLYSMIDNLGLRDKITAKLGPKAFILKSASGLLPAFYKSLKGSPKLIMNILGNIVFKKPDVLQQKIKNDKNEENYELLILAKETAVQGATAAVDAAKKKVTGAKAESTPPAEAAAKKEETKDPKTTKTTKTQFGKRKRGPSASLKRMCKKHGVRLTVKRGKTRVYKSSKVLKEQCQNKLKNKKKNFGQKKIKRSSIMPPKRKRSKKRTRLSYAEENPEKILAGLAGAGVLGLGGYEAYLAARRGLKTSGADTRFQSPTAAAFRRAKGGAMDVYDYFKDTPRDEIKKHIMSLPPAAKKKVIAAAEAAKKGTMGFPGRIRGFFSGKKEDNMQTFLQGPIGENKQSKARELDAMYNRSHGTFRGLQPLLYGKRRRRKRRSFGKKAKKPSAATRRMCKKLKVRMTLKRGKKRVYKSEAMLKKQCKKAMKRKSKK